MKIKLSLLLVIYVTFLSAAHAGWYTSATTNQMTDEKSYFANVKSKDKSALFFMYGGGYGRFTGSLQLLKRFRQINHTPKNIVIRIDKNPTHRIPFAVWEPQKVYFKLPVEVIDEISSGKKLLIQYSVSRSSALVETFTLNGSSKAIKKALTNYEPLRNGETRKQKIQSKQKAADEALDKREAEYERKTQTEAMVNCPGEYKEHKKLEKEYGRPQMWRGCSE